MSDIDFLAKKQPDDQDSRRQNDKKEKIIWSEPDTDKPLAKETPFQRLGFFNKKKVAGQPVTASLPVIDKNKIRESRREILKMIKHNETAELTKETKPGKSWLAELMGKLKSQPSHKDVLIDYQQVFNQGRVARGRSGPLYQNSGAVSNQINSTKPVASVRPALDKEPVTAKSVRPAVLAKTSPDEVGGSNLRRAPAPDPVLTKATGAKEKEIKTKEKILEPEKPVPTKEKPLEVLETNLIRGEIITFFDWHKKITLLINAILLPIFLIAAIYLALMYYQKQNELKISERAKQAADLTAEIEQTEIGLKEVTDFKAKLKIVSQVFAQHIYWTNFFKFLEDNTLKSVYYAAFSGDTSGDYSLDAIAENYSDISEQVGILRNNQKITDVRTLGGEAVTDKATNNNEVKFNLNFSILNNIFIE